MPKPLSAAFGAFAALFAARALAADVCISTEVQNKLNVCPSAPVTPTSRHDGAHVGVAMPPKLPVAQSKPQNDSSAALAKSIRRTALKPKQLQLLVVEIEQLVDLLQNTSKTSSDRPDLLRRLADAYALAESMSTEAKTQAQIAKNNAAAKKAEAQEQTYRHAAIKTLSILKDDHPKWCSQGKNGCIDEVLYDLAYEHEQDQKPDDARKVYLQLIKDHPTSSHVPAAYLAFGELFFKEAQGDPAKWALAEQAYKEVTKYPAPANGQLGYSHYKLGYVYWNQGDFARALSEMKKAIEHANAYPQSPGAKGLAEAARRDVVTVYAASGDGKKAFDFLKPLSGDGSGEVEKTLTMMDALGQAFLDIGHYPDAIATYQDLLNRDHHPPRACGYQAHIVEATLAQRSSDKQAISGELKKLLSMSDKIDRKADGWKTCANRAADLTVETAMGWHIEAIGSGGVRGTNDPKTMDQAAMLYDELLKRYSAADFKSFEYPRIVKEDWPTRSGVAYLRADLLYAKKDWEKCGPAFDAVVADDPTGKLAGESLYTSAVCYQNVYFTTHDKTTAHRGVDTKVTTDARELTDREKAMVSSFDRYLCGARPAANDKDGQTRWVEIAYARARTYFDARRWAEAAAGFRAIALDHAENEASVYAAQLYLEAVNVLYTHDHPSCIGDMERDAPKIVTLYCKGDRAKENTDACTGLDRVARDIERGGAEGHVKKGTPEELVKGADAYYAMWTSYGAAACEAGTPACDRMDEVLENGARAYQAAHLVAKSISLRKLLLDPKYHLDKTKIGKRAWYSIGATNQAIAVYDEAAAYYERYARESVDGENAAEALEDAVLLWLGLGEEDKANKAAQLFDKQYGLKKPALSAQIAFAIGDHDANKGDFASARKRLSSAMRIIDRDAAIDVQIEAHATLGRAMVATGGETAASAEMAKVRSFFKDIESVRKKLDALGGDTAAKERRLGKALTSYGEAVYFVAEQKRKEAERIKMPVYKGSGARADVLRFIEHDVKGWIQKKQPAIEAAETEYLRIKQITPLAPPRWVVAAGSRVGQLWGRFVAEFRAAPIPKEWLQNGPSPIEGLNWEDIRFEYWRGIDGASEPYKKRAKAAFQTCLEWSVGFRFFDGNARTCEQWLSKNYPGEFHVIDEIKRAPAWVDEKTKFDPAPLPPVLLAAPNK